MSNYLDDLCDGSELLCIVGECPLCSEHAEGSHAQVVLPGDAGNTSRFTDKIIGGAAELAGAPASYTLGVASGELTPATIQSTEQLSSRPALAVTLITPHTAGAVEHAGSFLAHSLPSEPAYDTSDTSAELVESIGQPDPVHTAAAPETLAGTLFGAALELDGASRLLELLSMPGVASDFLRAELAEDMTHSLYAFLIGAWHELEPGNPFEDGQHIRAICDHVQYQLEDRAIALGLMPKPVGWDKMRAQNLLIRIPPRSLKTVIVTIAASAWAWLRWPTLRILSLSSNPRVTTEASDKTRSLIRSAWYQNTFHPAWQIRADLDGTAKFANTAGGWRMARGITSRITGEGADWLIIDDPHDGQEVYSKAKREAVTNKWRRSVANRVNDPRYAIRTGIMQALHFDDWGQHRIADGWGVLLIRMEFEMRDAARVSPYGWTDWRKLEGEPIHPRFTAEWRAQERKDKGALDWAAQYQQDPAPIDGGIVKESDLRYYDELPSMESMCITVDAAFKKTTSGSRVSVLVVGRRGPDRYVIDNITRPMHMVETMDAIRELRAKWPQCKAKTLIEDKANGSEIVRQLKLEFAGVVAVNPGNNSKEGRLISVQSLFTGNNVYMPRHAAWLDDMKYEICTFPNAPKDDQVDALVQALLDMRISTGAARSRANMLT